MSQRIEHRAVRDILTDAISDGTVNAALFSTYTFSRSYFENEILSGFLGERGLKRGKSPVTVIVDPEMFEGSGWGYDVRLHREGRLWHPKITALFISEHAQVVHRRTFLLVGSGNLTASGWESNLELFLALGWDGWSLPKTIEKWIANAGFATESTFGTWYHKSSEGAPPRYAERSLLSSFDTGEIWNQWDWSDSWSVAHVLVPFMDSPEDEGSFETSRSYFRELLGLAGSHPKMHLYFNVAPDGRAYGHWPTIKALSKKADLKAYKVKGGRLHAKLQAVKAEGCWQILGGSPNPTANALLKGPSQRGNVEVAWQTTSRSLAGGLLPDHEEIDLKRWEFTAPKPFRHHKRWRALSRVRYSPRSRKLHARWVAPHGSWDTRILLADNEVQLEVPIKIGEERAVQTLPKSPGNKRGYDPDWVPIEFPPDQSDDPVLLEEWTLDQILSLLEGREIQNRTDYGIGNPTSSKAHSNEVVASGLDFPWHSKVSALERTVSNVTEKVEGVQSAHEASFWLNLIEKCMRSADPNEEGIPFFESKWRQWVRARICNSLFELDRRRAFSGEFVRIVEKWRRHVDKSLRSPVEE